MGPRIDMTGWIMSEHGVPDSLIVVIGLDEEWEKYRQENRLKKGSKWLCKCSCGSDKIFSVLGSDLKRKDGKGTRSCGCLHQKQMDNFWKETFVDLTNQEFGLLQVIKKVQSDEKSKTNKAKHAFWLCKCQCGNEVIVSSRDLRSGDTKSCGCLAKSFGEQVVKNFLDLNKISYEQEFSFSDLKDVLPLRFDFKIYSLQSFFLLEIQGLQHFQPVEYFGGMTGFVRNQQHDQMKQQYCLQKQIPLYTINNLSKNKGKIINELVKILQKEGVLSQDQIVE